MMVFHLVVVLIILKWFKFQSFFIINLTLSFKKSSCIGVYEYIQVTCADVVDLVILYNCNIILADLLLNVI